jgi:hypothetical protein
MITVTEQRVVVTVEETVVRLTVTPTVVSIGVSPGVTSFLGLFDTPDTYVGQSLKVARVNVGETALEFVTPSAGGVTDHGALTGLADDDHGQYHTDARGDARYWALSTDLATQVELDAEATARAGSDSTNATAIAAEASTRASADTTLQTNITNEAAARASADTTNANAISAEVAARIAADALLAPLASPSLTGTPTAPTAAAGTDTTQLATTGFVQQELGAVFGYNANNLDDGATAANVIYVGLDDKNGAWWLKKCDFSTAPATISHATITNNGATATYAAAWTARASLIYGRYDQAF